MGTHAAPGTAHPTVDLDELAASIDTVFPALTDRERTIALVVHRLLALGDPVPDYAIAIASGFDVVDVQAAMTDWPGVHRDERRRVVGFWGLAIPEMGHRFEVDGRVLHTWCAWDALFLPEILGKEARVTSKCAVTGEEIRLTIAPDGVRSGAHEALTVSMVDPERRDVEGDRIISTFCHHVLFFSTRGAAEEWAAERSGITLLTLDEAARLGRKCNALRYGDALRTDL